MIDDEALLCLELADTIFPMWLCCWKRDWFLGGVSTAFLVMREKAAGFSVDCGL